jgi:hypothetical protein
MICLVEHRDLDVVERHAATVEQVGQATGGRDHDVDAVAQGADLLVDRHTAVDRGEAQAHLLGERLHGRTDLGGQLTGREQDQAAGGLGTARTSGEPDEDREAEGQGLAGAGASATEHVASRERIGDHRLLDGTGVDDLLACQRGYQRGGEVEGGKGGQHRAAFRLIQGTHRRFGMNARYPFHARCATSSGRNSTGLVRSRIHILAVRCLAQRILECARGHANRSW